jgi:hypothetical protein
MTTINSLGRIFTITLLVGTVALVAAEPYEVTQLRTRREAEIRKVDTLYAEALERLKVKYTKQGDLENANYVQGLIKELGLSKNTDAVISKASLKNAILPIQKEAAIYSNRNYKWGDISEELKGYFYMQGTMRSLADIDVVVTSPGLLYCAFSTFDELHKNKMEAFLADGWRKSRFSIKDLIILEKSFPSGRAIIPWVHPHGGSILIFKDSK